MVFLQLFKKVLCYMAFSCVALLALCTTAAEHIAPPSYQVLKIAILNAFYLPTK